MLTFMLTFSAPETILSRLPARVVKSSAARRNQGIVIVPRWVYALSFSCKEEGEGRTKRKKINKAADTDLFTPLFFSNAHTRKRT
jgi:hypothetical protein